MTVLPIEEETGLPSSQTMVDGRSDYPLLAGEDLSFSDISGVGDDGLDDLIQRILRRNCASACKLASPRAPDLRTVVDKIVSEIAADLESRMSKAAPRRGRASDPRGKEPANEPLDACVRDILKWTKKQPYTHLAADYVAPFFEAFVLFVAHYIKTHFRNHGASGGLKPEDCRLILPIAKKDTEAERTDFYSPDYVDPTDFANVECGMFPLDSSVKRQVALTSTPLLIVADAEIVGHPDDFNEAELRLATKTKTLYFDQHNRRFAWGLIVSNHTIHAYVFGTDDIWESTAMDISGAKGRRAFISLLVDWSLCSVDRLGFDPSIRYVVDGSVGGPYLEIDVHDMDESTGKMKPRAYYSQRCLGTANRLTGRRDRYFAASTSRETLSTPTFLIKDMWTTADSGSVGDTRESSFLNVLHATFDKSSEFGSSFSRLVSSGPVYISRGNTLVADSTATAFTGLPSTTQGATKSSGNDQGSSSSNVQRSSNRQVRQHRRTVTKWIGNMISEADNQSQVVVAVADATVALNVAYAKCKILHGNISDRAILLQQTADGVKGVLADFDYASYAGDSAGAVEVPEPLLFQSIRSLENPGAVCTPLDDPESLFYLVCWLGTFGVNQQQRMAYVADPELPILEWNKGTAVHIARRKREHLTSSESFRENILYNMRQGLLRRLAADIHRALFLHPDCHGSIRITDEYVEEMEDGRTKAALREIPSINGRRDPLALHYIPTTMNDIVANFQLAVARYRDVAPAVLATGGAVKGSKAVTLPSASPSMKHYRDEVSLAGPSKRPRY
ncbi:hypothetical protein GGI19_003791 [Coemansia pectinata]|uniref:Fungal-type protein kinase domain-containing protein n=1 Tax=Coemansia pectinata TaxID=1052879 RepID=A0A9W8L9Z9_9FUNG|nr:hypothetical protein GGI19_003791 [Coemansia pectinata]